MQFAFLFLCFFFFTSLYSFTKKKSYTSHAFP